ncbi:DMT family transporter [Ktedonobacter robiniae]|uniref:Peptide ABC transporter ATP-binding protein n=1 Tax=Ktedonobacter robiniae TaxID=2778365 RepID=A0ABQ3V336_9CHLR|nr:DMT family transporter [Ktedonobacter robiniae]GHO59371.1 peptide ABC transporter ATP-binding protein [Ktedonobacter robiniae]
MDTADQARAVRQEPSTDFSRQNESTVGKVASLTRRSPLIVAVALFYILLWGSAFIATKVGVSYSPPLTFLAIRFLVAALLMALLAWAWRVPWPRGWAAWGRLSLFGLLNCALYLGCNYEALRSLSAGMGSIIAATNPLLLTLVAPFVLRERLTWWRVLGLLLGFGGVLFVMGARLNGNGQLDTVGGMLISFIGVIGLVAATLFYKRYPPREHAFVVNTVQLGAAGLALLIPALLFEHPEQFTLNAPLIESFLYLVLVISIGASLLWFWLLQRGEASVVSAYYFLTPIAGLALAALLLGEPFTLRDALGLVAVAAGIALINRPVRARD